MRTQMSPAGRLAKVSCSPFQSELCFSQLCQSLIVSILVSSESAVSIVALTRPATFLNNSSHLFSAAFPQPLLHCSVLFSRYPCEFTLAETKDGSMLSSVLLPSRHSLCLCGWCWLASWMSKLPIRLSDIPRTGTGIQPSNISVSVPLTLS